MDFDDEYEYDTYVHSYPKLRTGRKKRGGKGKEGFYQIQEPKPGGEGTVPTGDIPHVVYINYYVATTCGGSPL